MQWRQVSASFKWFNAVLDPFSRSFRRGENFILNELWIRSPVTRTSLHPTSPGEVEAESGSGRQGMGHAVSHRTTGGQSESERASLSGERLSFDINIKPSALGGLVQATHVQGALF